MNYGSVSENGVHSSLTYSMYSICIFYYFIYALLTFCVHVKYLCQSTKQH